MAEEVEDTFDKLKAGAKAIAKKVAIQIKTLVESIKKKRKGGEF